MQNETILGKITYVHFGVTDGRFGLTLTLSGSWSAQTSDVVWDPVETPPVEHARWTVEDQDKALAEMLRRVSKLLNDAKVSDVKNLLGKPVEFTSKDGMLNTWRILTEVL